MSSSDLENYYASLWLFYKSTQKTFFWQIGISVIGSLFGIIMIIVNCVIIMSSW